MSVEGEDVTAPYMAIAGFSRVSGRSNLHGVDYPIGNYIVFRVYQGKVKRSSTSDFHMADHRLPVVEIAMSEVQFAQMISGFNIGDGVPCTFKYRPEPGTKMIQVEMPEPGATTEEKFTADVRETTADAVKATQDALNLLNEVLAGKTVGKNQVREIQQHVETIKRELDANLNFILRRADEAIANRVTKGKAEMQAYASHIVTQMGLRAAGEHALANQVEGHLLIEDKRPDATP